LPERSWKKIQISVFLFSWCRPWTMEMAIAFVFVTWIYQRVQDSCKTQSLQLEFPTDRERKYCKPTKP
jgi:hypothetical protein